jgi:biopolymer transport protein ExbB
MQEEVLQDLTSILDRGGYVMIPLLVLSVLSVALIIERCWFWLSTCGKISLRRLESLNKSFMVGDTESVRKMVTRDTSLFGVIATKLVEDGPSDAVAMGAVEMQRPRIDRNMVALSTIITAAPLLGILGTVIGIIDSFKLLGADVVLTDPADVASGIAAALLTTAFGLIIALVTLFPYMLFRERSSKAIGRIETMIAAAQQGTEK